MFPVLTWQTSLTAVSWGRQRRLVQGWSAGGRLCHIQLQISSDYSLTLRNEILQPPSLLDSSHVKRLKHPFSKNMKLSFPSLKSNSS